MQEAKVLLALIARRYDIQNVSGPVDWGVHSTPKLPPYRHTVVSRFGAPGGLDFMER